MEKRYQANLESMGEGATLDQEHHSDSKRRPMAKLRLWLERQLKKDHQVVAQLPDPDLSTPSQKYPNLRWRLAKHEADISIPFRLRERVDDWNDPYDAERALTENNDSDDLLSIRADMARFALYYRGGRRDEWILLDRRALEAAHGLTYQQQLMLKHLGGSDYFKHLNWLGQDRIWREYRHLVELSPREAIEELAAIADSTRHLARGALWSVGQVPEGDYEAMMERLTDGSATRELELAIDAELDRCSLFDVRSAHGVVGMPHDADPDWHEKRTISLPFGRPQPKPESSRLPADQFPFAAQTPAANTDDAPLPFDQKSIAEQRQIVKTSRRALRTAPPFKLATRGPVAAEEHRVDRYGAEARVISDAAREGIESEGKAAGRANRAKVQVKIRGFGDEEEEDDEEDALDLGRGGGGMRGRADAEHPGRSVNPRYTAAGQSMEKGIRTNDPLLRAADQETTLSDPARLALCVSTSNLPPPGTNLNPLVQALPAVSAIVSDAARCVSRAMDVYLRRISEKGWRSFGEELFEKPKRLEEVIEAMTSELEGSTFEQALQLKGRAFDLTSMSRTRPRGPSKVGLVELIAGQFPGVQRSRPVGGWTEGTADELLKEFQHYAPMLDSMPRTGRHVSGDRKQTGTRSTG